MNRPLPDEHLEYAGQDAYLIYSLYDYFSRVGYLSLVAVEQSMRYISLHRHSPPDRDNIYAAHPLLPLGILGDGPIYGLTKTCLGCNRTLSLFGLSPSEVSSRCFVCRAVDIRRQSARRTTTEIKLRKVEEIAQLGDEQVCPLSHDATARACGAVSTSMSTIPHSYFVSGRTIDVDLRISPMRR